MRALNFQMLSAKMLSAKIVFIDWDTLERKIMYTVQNNFLNFFPVELCHKYARKAQNSPLRWAFNRNGPCLQKIPLVQISKLPWNPLVFFMNYLQPHACYCNYQLLIYYISILIMFLKLQKKWCWMVLLNLQSDLPEKFGCDFLSHTLLLCTDKFPIFEHWIWEHF